MCYNYSVGKNIRGVAHLAVIIVVILLAIGGVGYLVYQNSQQVNQLSQDQLTPSATSTPTVTTDTEEGEVGPGIYNNTSYKYSIEYPANYYLYASKGELSSHVIITNYDETKLTVAQIKNPYWPGKVKVEINVFTEDSDIKVHTLEESLGPEEAKKILISKINSLDGHRGTKKVYKRDSDVTTVHYDFTKNKADYSIISTIVVPSTIEDLNKILSTFEFLD